MRVCVSIFIKTFKSTYAVACCVDCTTSVVTTDTVSLGFSSFSVIANHGNRF